MVECGGFRIAVSEGCRTESGASECRVFSSGRGFVQVVLKPGMKIFWPNREGELLEFESIEGTLDKWGVKSASLGYPSTCSMRMFLVWDSTERRGLELYAADKSDGRIATMSLSAAGQSAYIRYEAGTLDLSIRGVSAASFEEFVSRSVKDHIGLCTLPERTKRSAFQAQVGFFDPEGNCSVPSGQGYSVLEPVAALLERKLGRDNIIHLFAYHNAHDSHYPDYFANPSLGGEDGLRKAIEKVHEHHQLCSLYMNARLFSSSLLEKYPELESSVIKSPDGSYETESYQGREFFVMNPVSAVWRALLVERASYLVSLGADIIQLDQIAGRAAVGEIGDEWGSGYVSLIRAIEALGAEVWIQGVNELYPVSRFELCFRYPSVLEDGTVRGGHPFGVSYPVVPFLLKGQNFLIPKGSAELIRFIPSCRVTVDLEHTPGGLSLWNPGFMKTLEQSIDSYLGDGE